MKHDGTDELIEAELTLARGGQEIAAIKAFRNRTMCGLKQAYEAVHRAKLGLPRDVQKVPCTHCEGRGYFWKKLDDSQS